MKMKQKGATKPQIAAIGLMCLLSALLFSSIAFADSMNAVTEMNGQLFQGQQSAERTYQEEGHFYVIHFDYNTEVASVPAVRGAQMHYSAKISVYEIMDGEKKLISSFGGQYTENGCFEDDPKSLVKQARERAGGR